MALRRGGKGCLNAIGFLIALLVVPVFRNGDQDGLARQPVMFSPSPWACRGRRLPQRRLGSRTSRLVALVRSARNTVEEVSTVAEWQPRQGLRGSLCTGHSTLYSGTFGPEKPDQYAQPTTEDASAPSRPTTGDADDCPFCVNNVHTTPTSLLWVDKDMNLRGADDPLEPEGWVARAFINLYPLVDIPPGLYREIEYAKVRQVNPAALVPPGALDSFNNSDPDFLITHEEEAPAVGFSEVIVESQEHIDATAALPPKQLELVLQMLQNRSKVLAQQEYVHEVCAFKQTGKNGGGSLKHPHWQVVTAPFPGEEVRLRLDKATTYFKRHGKCVTCNTLVEEPVNLMAERRRIYSNDHFNAVVPWCGRQDRVTIAPKEHQHSWLNMPVDHIPALADALQMILKALGMKHTHDFDYDINIVSYDTKALLDWWQAREPDVNVTEALHWTLEVQPRFEVEVGGFELASGHRVNVNKGRPEAVADELKQRINAILKERDNANEP